MNNNFKKYLVFLSLILLLNVLSACAPNSPDDVSVDVPQKNISPRTSSGLSNQEGFSSSNNAIGKKITINHRCTACGRCSLFDPEHFKDYGRRVVPEIISQNNLESSNLQKAVKSCPVNAIVIN